MFVEIKNRDAWSTVRGFVYQVDTTILRWLDIADNELLEIEKGEDIDIVTRDIENDEISRELEQIKYRANNITLNHDLTIESLFNFFLHRINNPDYRVYFRFVTNANYGIERPALFFDGKSAIEVWLDMFNSNIINKNDDRYLTIKKHLLKRITDKLYQFKESDKSKTDTWKSFYTYVEDDENLIQIISDFDWSFGNEDSSNISALIRKKLVESELVTDVSETGIIYSRLFLYIFKLLCKKTSKTLDKPELRRQTTLTELNSADKKTIELINTILNNIDHKVNELEDKVSLNTAQISSLVNDISLINNSDTVFDFRLKNISVMPPSLIKNGTLRKDKVLEIRNLFTKYSWIHFQGINGTGKSQLAALVCNEYKNYWWLDLRPYIQNNEKATLFVEVFLATISNCPIKKERKVWIKMVVDSFLENTLVVLNDLPRVEKDSELNELLILISNYASISNIKLLTTSNYKVSSIIKHSLTENILHEYFDFKFTDDEIIEFLVNNGASESITKYIKLLTVISERNPRIVNAIIHRLRDIKWGQDSNDVFDVFFKKEFSTELFEDAQLSIKRYIPDSNSRELLYRLSLIHWNFNHKEIIIVSELEEKIAYPNEKLQDLLYIWIQDHGTSFQVSPLIHDIGENNLSPEVIQNVYTAIARSILSTKKLDQISASRSISFFIKGNDYNNAGIVLLNLYQSAISNEEIKILSSWGYLNYWSEIDIPKEMSIILRSFIRKEQIRLNQALEKDTIKFENRLEEYIKEDTLTISENLFVRLIILSNFNLSQFSNYWIHLDYVLKNWKEIETPFKSIINNEMFSGLLWSIIPNLKSENEIYAWFENIEVYESDFKINFFENEIAQTAITIISNNIVKSESHKEAPNWELVGKTLFILINNFKKRNLEVLETVAYKEFLVLEYNVSKNKRKVEELTIKELSKVSSEESKYLLLENLGKLYYNDKKIEKAKKWLLKALDINCTSQPNYIDTLIYGAASISLVDSKKSVDFCEKAIELAKSKDDYLELDYIQILGELAIAYWINKDYIKSFETFEDVVNRLLKNKSKELNPYWIRLFSWCGHTLGYISSSVARDRAPEYFNDGGKYVKPYQGIFSFNTKDLSDLYNTINDPILLAHLAMFSEGINNVSKAYHWSLRAFDFARANGDQKILLMISGVCSQYSLINFKVEETLESYLLFSIVSVHLVGNTPEEKHASLTSINLNEVLSTKPSKKWSIAEETTVSFAIIPLFIIVLTYHLEDSEIKSEYRESFKNMLYTYIPKASNKILWELILELSTRILDYSISEDELTNRGNTFGQQERKELQIICFLGLIYTTSDNEKRLALILNIVPYLTKINKTTKSVIKFVLIPFVRNLCLNILKDCYVGTRTEYEEMVDHINKLDILNNNTIQKIIQPIVTELDIKISTNIKNWLFDYKEN